MEQSLKPPHKGIPILYVILFFVCLASMNLINRYFYCLFIALGFFCLRKGSKVYFDPLSFFALLVLALSMILFSPNTVVSPTGLLKPFTYVFCFIMGMGLFEGGTFDERGESGYRGFYLLVTVIALGLLIHYALNWYINFDSYESRNTIDVWTGEVLAATGQAAIACIPLALAIACISSECRRLFKVFAWITIGIVLGYNLILSGRTLLLMTLLLALLAFFHRFLVVKQGRARTVLIVLIGIAVGLLIYEFNVFGVRSFIEDSPLYDRFFATDSTMEFNDDQRLDRKWYYLQNLYRYPFGGTHLRDIVGYSHDLYFDTFDEAGVFAFLAVIVYVLRSVGTLINCLKDKTLPFALRQIGFCVYVGIYIVFFLEPILQGMPWLFASFCMLEGYLHRLIHHNATKKQLLR